MCLTKFGIIKVGKLGEQRDEHSSCVLLTLYFPFLTGTITEAIHLHSSFLLQTQRDKI